MSDDSCRLKDGMMFGILFILLSVGASVLVYVQSYPTATFCSLAAVAAAAYSAGEITKL